MLRTLAAEVPHKLNEKVFLQGWVYHFRPIGKLCFLVLRDRSGTVQAVLYDRADVADHLREESVVELVGYVRRDERAPNGCEVLVSDLKILSTPVEPLPIQINRPRAAINVRLETLLEHRVLSLRHPEIGAIFKVQAELIHGFREFLIQEGFLEVHTPKIVASGTEGGTELFPVQYFERTAYLAQSPQFYKQMLVGAGFERVFEVGPVYRAEPHSTTRHLNEYISLDIEMGFIESEQDLLDLEARLLRHIFARVQERCAKELALYGATIPKIPEKIPQIKLAEAQAILQQRFNKESTGDLDPESERLLCRYAQEELGCELLFVTHYPRQKRPMYAMPDPQNPHLTRSFDLLYKGLEITTGGQRIHQYPMLVESIRGRGLDPANFEFYLEVFKSGMPPHGGFAIGAERLTMQLLNLSNVREASLFPRDRSRLTP
ncbi:MAG: aspartate--tRNA(Asn) ligase [Candidatus Bipolaricaulota bacterium]|nr:aspartate--tRNA(Asn) ligase [Candidatus Bipolaricaulota bacterium]MCS7273873.1 aspartate--tRNA(Asn) ligase [Candidatus Bipolaricaulota bacterium]MDW8110709.1 aspartate--tRNA(Asn) ligase [Candidatus Bipolaricaulota bacterium]MDW8328433.1 aspartate--tRNA(Asn) ligase [Candidatus Bipolaricaulota bacterium]